MSDTYRQAWGLFDGLPDAYYSALLRTPTEHDSLHNDTQQLRRDIGHLKKRSTHPDSPPNSEEAAQLNARIDSLAATVYRDRSPPSRSKSDPSVSPTRQSGLDLSTVNSNPGIAPDFPEALSSVPSASSSNPSVPQQRLPSLQSDSQRQKQQPAAAAPPGDLGRERPRCWKACCRGKKFSNYSNLVRHQRETTGSAVKLRCSFCDAVFTRSSARNAHEIKRKCGGALG